MDKGEAHEDLALHKEQMATKEFWEVDTVFLREDNTNRLSSARQSWKIPYVQHYAYSAGYV